MDVGANPLHASAHYGASRPRIMDVGAKDWRAVLLLPADRRLTSDSIKQAWKAVSFEVHPDLCHAPDAEIAFKRAGEAHDALAKALKKEAMRAEEKAAKGAAAKPKAPAAVARI